MAEEEEVDKYKRLFDEQKAKVKELERQNSQLKDVIQQLMAVGRQGNSKASLTPAAAATAASVTGNNTSDTRVGGGGGGGQRNARTRPGGAGGRGGRGNGAANQRGSQANSEKVGQESSIAAAGATAVTAARTAKASEPPQPTEPDVRVEIVALMREASMSKDATKLEEAIKKAEEAGLHFEANQGRRQLGRITG